MTAPSTSNPLPIKEMQAHIDGLSASGNPMIQKASDAINTITCMRAIQIGYIKACQDHGLPVPEFTDPAEMVAGGYFRA